MPEGGIDSPPDQAALTASRGWRARLWIPRAALECRDRDEQARLWLLLDDGRVLVFRLAGATPDDALLDALARSLADDARGDLLEVRLAAPVPATFLVLYGAPASPVFCVDQANPMFGAALAFHAGLDGTVLAALAGLVGANTFWASARNYNRLAAHPRRRERLQALARFPFLVAPILLTRQRWPNLFDPKRYRWRAHDAAVVESIEAGRDLVGELAACYGISRRLVRSPLCAAPWVASTGLALADFLRFVDAIPPNRRPQSVDDVDVFGSHLPALWGLFGRHVLAGAGAFRAGYVAVWQSLEQRFPALNESLVDAGDYLRVLVRWLLAIHRRRIDPGRLAALWAGQRGLASLLQAAARWHAFRQRRGSFADPNLPGTVPAILGEWREGAWQSRELATRESLARRGTGHVPLRRRLLGGLRSARQPGLRARIGCRFRHGRNRRRAARAGHGALRGRGRWRFAPVWPRPVAWSAQCTGQRGAAGFCAPCRARVERAAARRAARTGPAGGPGCREAKPAAGART